MNTAILESMRKILVVTGDAGESYEALYAVHRFREAGFDPVVAAPAKRRLHLVMHDFEPGWDTYVERPGYGLDADVALEDVQIVDFEAILLLGGRAPEYLRHNARLLHLTREFSKAGKWIFSLCHGIQILAAANLLHGQTVTCYEHVRTEVEQCGGTFCASQAVRHGNVVTGQTWQSHPEFYREVFACLAG